MLGAEGDDCYDSNSDVHPGQTSYFTVDRGDGSFDYDCSGSEEKDSGCNSCSCTATGICNLGVGGPPCTQDNYDKITFSCYAALSCGSTSSRTCCEWTSIRTNPSFDCVYGYIDKISCTSGSYDWGCGSCGNFLCGAFEKNVEVNVAGDCRCH